MCSGRFPLPASIFTRNGSKKVSCQSGSCTDGCWDKVSLITGTSKPFFEILYTVITVRFVTFLHIPCCVPLHNTCHALYYLLHNTSFHMPCFTFAVLHFLTIYAMLYVPYSALPHSICHAVHSLFHTASFHVTCCILLLCTPSIHIPYCTFSILHLLISCCTLPIPHHLILYGMQYVPYFA